MSAKRKPASDPPSLLKQFWAFSASLKLLLVILGLGSIPLVVGTLIQQKPLGGFNPEKVLEQLGPYIFSLCEVFGVFDIYHSWYFQVLLVLLAYNNICCTIDRFFLTKRWRTLKGVGVVIIHLGVNVVLIGSFIGGRYGVEGFMQVFENGPPVDSMVNFASQKVIPLPFSVQLDDFRLDMYDKPEERVFLVDGTNTDNQHPFLIDTSGSLPQTYAIGRQDLISKALRWLQGGPQEAIVVEDYYPDAEFEPVVKPTPDGSGIWAVELETAYRDRVGHGYVPADTGRRQELVPDTFSVAYLRTYTDAQLQQALASRPDISEPTLLVHDQQTGLTTPFPAVEAGDEIQVLDGTATVRVLDYQPNFGRSGAEDGEALNPALRVELVTGETSRVGWLFAKFSSTSVIQNQRIRLNFAQGTLPGSTPHEMDLVVGPDEDRHLVYRHNGEVKAVQDAPPGATFTVPALGATVSIVDYINGGNFEVEVTNQSDEPRNPAVKVKLLDEGEPIATQWVFERQPTAVEGTKWRLVYQRDFSIEEFQSDLTVYQDGEKVVDSQEIVVNRPLKVDGYNLFQSSYDEQNLRWSGLQVKKDPGIPIIYSGFVLMFAGIIFLFYVRPILEARRKGTPLIAQVQQHDENKED